ncbi:MULTISPECIES: hypothetical protein [unclassified Nocardioides]|uniref:hypothetical protein n=1 Tax=unclassified Nocardioides TaxID=2615069 RepID=UPI003616B2FD
MESDEIRRTLRKADRAEAAPWIDYPPTPRWYPFAVGTWAALLTLVLAELEDATRMAGAVGLIAIELAFLRWYVGYRGGVMPTGSAPREFRAAILCFVLTAAAIVLGATALVANVATWAAVVFVLVAVTLGIGWYERVYAGAAARARTRLA